MIFALLPVKAPQNAKRRLDGVLSGAAREALARAMYEEMLEKICAARGFDRVAIVTSDEAAAGRARQAGALVFEERRQISHSHSADAAAAEALRLGARAVVLLPIDVPLSTVAEIEQLAAAARRSGVGIVPSADGTGTNALVRTPPDVIAARFGPGSFRAHFDEARAKGFEPEVLRLPGLMFDIDTPADVAELLARAPRSPIAQMLAPQWTSTSQG